MKSRFAAGVRHTFDIRAIIAITGSVNYSYVYSLNSDYQLHSRTLKWFVDRCPTLLRIHKHTLINVDYVHYYSLKKGRRPLGYVILKNNMRLEVSRRNMVQVGQILEMMTRYRALYATSLGAPIKHILLMECQLAPPDRFKLQPSIRALSEPVPLAILLLSASSLAA